DPGRARDGFEDIAMISGKFAQAAFHGRVDTPDGERVRMVAWASRRMELAAWTWQLLVNRVDAWVGYWRDKNADGSATRQTTRPPPPHRGNVYLTERILANHFAATDTRFIVGRL